MIGKKDIKRMIDETRPVKRDTEFYLKNIEVEESMMTRATAIAERMLTAFLRENRVQVQIDPDELVNKIIEKLIPRLSEGISVNVGTTESIKKNNFELNTNPIILNTEKVIVKGELGKTSKSDESIDKNLEALKGFSL